MRLLSWFFLLELVIVFMPRAAMAQKLYFVNRKSEQVMRVDPDGANKEILFDRVISGPSGIVADRSGGFLYWSDAGLRAIKRSKLDGTEVQTLVETQLPQAIALDLPRQRILWGDRIYRAIYRCDLDGSNSSLLIATDYYPNSVHVGLDGRICWSAGSGIFVADSDGNNIQQLILEVDLIAAMALDSQAGFLFWSIDRNYSAINRSNLDGSNIVTITEITAQEPDAIAVDTTNNQLYWSINRQLKRTPYDGSNQEMLLTTPHVLYGLSIDGPTGIAVGLTGGPNDPHIVEIQLQTPTVRTILSPPVPSFSEIAIDSLSGKLYLLGIGGLWRANLDGSGLEPYMLTTQTWYSLAIDSNMQSLFLAQRHNFLSHLIGIFHLDLVSGSMQLIFQQYRDYDPQITTIDSATQTLYLVSSYPGLIERMSSDGSGLDQIEFDVIPTCPTDFEIDPNTGDFYWIECVGNIKRASSNGTNIAVLIDDNAGSQSLSLDSESHRLFWTDGSGYFPTDYSIAVSNLDGTNRSVIVDGLREPNSLQFHSKPHIIDTRPEHCGIDARAFDRSTPTPLDSGIQNVVLTMSGPTLATNTGDWYVSENPSGSMTPLIQSATLNSDTEISIGFSHPIDSNRWTCVHHQMSGTKTCVGSLPGDTNEDRKVDANDAYTLWKYLTSPALNDPLRCDIDSSGVCDGEDIVALINGFNGIGGQAKWVGTTLPMCP